MNRVAASILIILIFIVPLSLYWSQSALSHETQIRLTGRMADAGGWSKDGIVLEAGEQVTFQLSSEDVMHGFAIGLVDLPVVDVFPGEWSTYTWIPQQPGEYTFYCTRWCGPDHWRMTGSIRVVDTAGTFPAPTSPPTARYQYYGVNIDDRETTPVLLDIRPQGSLAEHAQLSMESWRDEIDPDLTTPLGVFEKLRGEATLHAFSDDEIWNLVASLWRRDLNPVRLDKGKRIFESNCAACHGSSGEGDGVMASGFEDPVVANFTDLSRMATANTVILEGKILRGGMGTGMPYWGTILTREEIRAVVEYLWSLLWDG